MNRFIVASVSAALLASAVHAPAHAQSAAASSAAPDSARATAAAPAPATLRRAITPAPAGADTCGATALTSLVGQSRTAIPIADDISKRRVVCTTCPRTLDYRADRLTIFYDAQTGRVTTLQCG